MGAGRDRGRWPGDLHVGGVVSADQWKIGTGAVGDEEIADGADVDATKLQHQDRHLYTQLHGTAVASKRSTLFIANAAGTIFSALAGVVVPSTGDALITIDLLKNGVTILTDAWEIASTDGAYDLVDASLDPALAIYTAGDWFEVVVTAAAGTGALGQALAVLALTRELAA